MKDTVTFTLTSCIFTDREGQESFLDLKKTGKNCFTAKNASAEAEIQILTGGELQALTFSGSFTDDLLISAPNKSFSALDGVKVKLTLPEETPFLAIYQHKPWWLRPAFGSRFCEIPSRTQLILTRRDACYECYLAVCGEHCRTDLEGCADGILLSLSSACAGMRRLEDCMLICGQGRDPYALIEKAFSYALKLTGRTLPLRSKKSFPDVFETIGWCTWDSLGQEVSEQAIFEKMDEFQEKKIPISWVLIDDGWSDCDFEKRTLRSCRADPVRFPSGLEGTIRVLKETYQVRYVGVWQAMQGYWNGIEPGSEAESDLRPYLKKYPDGVLTVRPDAAASFGFWNTWHTSLKKWGVDFVKVDNQSSFSEIFYGNETFGEGFTALYEGLDASVSLNFDGRLINCMGMPPECLWNRKNSALSRNSDDYFPRQPGSFTEHALQNCYNSLYIGSLYWEDWDMVWSDIPNAEQGILLRIISGGPFYLSDDLHATDPNLIRKVILPDGTVTRCRDVAKPTLDCLTDPRVLIQRGLKIFNSYEEVIYTAVFLAAEAAAETAEQIRREDFPDLLPAAYWIYDPKTEQAALCEGEEAYSLTVQPGECSLIQILPADRDVAVIGIVEKYISRACVEEISDDGEEILVRVKCAGTFCFLTQKEIRSICIDGKSAEFRKENALVSVPVAEDDTVIGIRL